MKKKYKGKKLIGVFVDLAMYLVMLSQMLYVMIGNTVHEILGMGFFALLVCHMIIKRNWFKAVFHRQGKWFSARRFADLMIILLLLNMVILALSSMGVSRMLFPKVTFLGSPTFHSTLATLGLTFAVIHGGMHGYFAAKKKKRAVVIIVLLAAIALGIGFGLVPYLNRHFRTVEVDAASVISEEKFTWKSGRPIIVYFTRVGNTDFDPDIDAVSGASLLKVDGELMGNTQFMANRLEEILQCDAKAITLTGEKYPSSYSETCIVGGDEIKEGARPEIEEIDVSDYDDIILVYPIWWGTIPMPVASFLQSQSFAGKNIYLIATQGSSGFASSTEDISELVPDAKVEEGISVYCDDIPMSGDLLIDWLKNK